MTDQDFFDEAILRAMDRLATDPELQRQAQQVPRGANDGEEDVFARWAREEAESLFAERNRWWEEGPNNPQNKEAQ